MGILIISTIKYLLKILNCNIGLKYVYIYLAARKRKDISPAWHPVVANKTMGMGKVALVS